MDGRTSTDLMLVPSWSVGERAYSEDMSEALAEGTREVFNSVLTFPRRIRVVCY